MSTVPPLPKPTFKLWSSLPSPKAGPKQVGDLSTELYGYGSLTGSSVAKERQKNGLGALDTYIIDVIGPAESLGIDMSAEEVKDIKMGSTAIRTWLDAQAKGEP
jgi:hypothetical protein